MRWFLCFLLAVILSQNLGCQEVPAQIAVVKTWEDLQKQPAIDLGDGVKIRLGLEAKKIPQWSGGLLYCLAEGYTPLVRGGTNDLGPVSAEVFLDQRMGALQFKCTSMQSPKGTYLYVRAVTIDRVGVYRVKVTDRKDNVLAQASVEGTNEFFHPWMPWVWGYKPYESPCEKGIALPCVGAFPFAQVKEGKVPVGKLPTLLPTDDKPTLTIKMDGQTMLVSAESEFETSWPGSHFLARWWVNDKPFVPKRFNESLEDVRSGAIIMAREWRQEFEFHPERIGAKPGDRIGLQVMYCDREWDPVDDGSASGLHCALDREHEHAIVSNRIEFVVPAKP